MLNDRPARLDSAASEGLELIAFRAGNQDFCVDVQSVKEIRGRTPMTLLPHSPAYVRGVINLRGTVLPIVDLRARLDLAPSAEGSGVVIVVWIGRKLVGLLVDEVCDILTVSAGDVQQTPELSCPTVSFLVSALVKLGEDRIAGLLALGRLLPEEDPR